MPSRSKAPLTLTASPPSAAGTALRISRRASAGTAVLRPRRRVSASASPPDARSTCAAREATCVGSPSPPKRQCQRAAVSAARYGSAAKSRSSSTTASPGGPPRSPHEISSRRARAIPSLSRTDSADPARPPPGRYARRRGPPRTGDGPPPRATALRSPGGRRAARPGTGPLRCPAPRLKESHAATRAGCGDGSRRAAADRLSRRAHSSSAAISWAAGSQAPLLIRSSIRFPRAIRCEVLPVQRPPRPPAPLRGAARTAPALPRVRVAARSSSSSARSPGWSFAAPIASSRRTIARAYSRRSERPRLLREKARGEAVAVRAEREGPKLCVDGLLLELAREGRARAPARGPVSMRSPPGERRRRGSASSRRGAWHRRDPRTPEPSLPGAAPGLLPGGAFERSRRMGGAAGAAPGRSRHTATSANRSFARRRSSARPRGPAASSAPASRRLPQISRLSAE